MTSRCLWHACRALVLGMVLMFVGGGMATVGYYANNFPSLSDVKSNSTSTVRVKNEHRGLHLNNLSYVGPIIMGVGGFIVVASCVMTFEARDSAAKVVPARFKVSANGRNPSRSNNSRRSTGISNGPTSVSAQTARWEQHLGVFRTSPATEQVPDRKALTAALVHFSKALSSTPKTSPHRRQSRRVSRSGSVPNLCGDKLSVPVAAGSPASGSRSAVRHHRGSRVSSMVQRSTRDTGGGLLHPGMLQFHRHALSVDDPEPLARALLQAGSHGSVQYGGDGMLGHKLRDRNKRSDTARKHVLSRQTKIEKDDPGHGAVGSPKHGHSAISRRASTISNASASSKLNKSSRRASTVSKTPSIDSRGAASTMEIVSPDRSLMALTPRKGPPIGPLSTPLVERECRSQLSICSEPAIAQRNLSCQSSLEPCVPEEDGPDQEPEGPPAAPDLGTPLRPDSLLLEDGSDSGDRQNRFLYRSNSTKSFRKPKPKITSKKLSNEYDQIYVISSASNGAVGVTAGSNRYPNFYHARHDDDHYDSIEVIHERRSKNFSKFSSSSMSEACPATVTAGETGPEPGSNRISVVADISPALSNLRTSPDDRRCPTVVHQVDAAVTEIAPGATVRTPAGTESVGSTGNVTSAPDASVDDDDDDDVDADDDARENV